MIRLRSYFCSLGEVKVREEGEVRIREDCCFSKFELRNLDKMASKNCFSTLKTENLSKKFRG